jgi:hypothetical protein
MRPEAARTQACQTERGASFQMFVAGLSADPELLAMNRDVNASALREDYVRRGSHARPATHHAALHAITPPQFTTQYRSQAKKIYQMKKNFFVRRLNQTRRRNHEF